MTEKNVSNEKMTEKRFVAMYVVGGDMAIVDTHTAISYSTIGNIEELLNKIKKQEIIVKQAQKLIELDRW